MQIFLSFHLINMVTDYRLENHLQDEIKYSHGPLRNHYKSNRTSKQQQVSLT